MADLIDRSALLTVPNVRKVTEYDETGCGMDYLAVPVEAINAAPACTPRWIPVEERLPEDGKNVLIFVRTMSRWWHIEVDWRDGNSWYNNAETDWNKITHWMPLPEPPKEESKG